MTNVYENTLRVGVLPAIKINGVWHYKFMIPSNPEFGGSKPQVAKGRMEEDGSDALENALREGFEELGLLKHNISAIYGPTTGIMSGKFADFTIHAWLAVVKDMKDFGEPHFETGETLWMNAALARVRMRKSQLQLFENLVALTPED